MQGALSPTLHRKPCPLQHGCKQASPSAHKLISCNSSSCRNWRSFCCKLTQTALRSLVGLGAAAGGAIGRGVVLERCPAGGLPAWQASEGLELPELILWGSLSTAASCACPSARQQRRRGASSSTEVPPPPQPALARRGATSGAVVESTPFLPGCQLLPLINGVGGSTSTAIAASLGAGGTRMLPCNVSIAPSSAPPWQVCRPPPCGGGGADCDRGCGSSVA